MESIWSKTCDLAPREPLSGDLETEIAVIGGGMAGVLTAYYLQKAGHQVVILEANRLGSGQTKNTTAKITAQHGLKYEKLVKVVGMAQARQYAQANLAAVGQFAQLIAREGIDCDFETVDSYVYGQEEKTLRAEAETAVRLGLPASFETGDFLPFPVAGTVKFTGQAQFHPLKFLKALASDLQVYEQTPVQKAEGDCLTTPHGTVRAGKVVFACHFPFLNFPGMYFARMHQERSYVLALENAPKFPGMAVGQGKDAFSFRNYGDLLLLGGGGHRTGQNEGGRYQMLRDRAAQWFPESREAACWSAQDCVTLDEVPYIGCFSRKTPNYLVATGFGKWGMTHSMVAAQLLLDQVEGRSNSNAQVFAPQRLEPETIPVAAAEGGRTARSLLRQLFHIPEEQAEALAPGQGGVVILDGEKVGVYKDPNGQLHPVSIRCPHLGCELSWNPDENAWECPCHGSRFDAYGNLVSGPAQEPIN